MNRVAKLAYLAVLCHTIFAGVVPSALAQARQQDAAAITRRNATESELESIAIIERKVLVPMRDGKRMQADIYRPKDESKKYPIIFVRTPYNFNYWDVELGAPRDMSAPLEAVKHGYAYIEMNERAVLDYEMPLMKGTEVAQRLRAIQPALPIIIVSGSDLPEDAATVADSCLYKVGMGTALVPEVNRLLGSRK